MDKVSEKVKADFEPLLEKCKELEISSEEKLPSLNDQTNEKSVKLLRELLNEFREEYDRFIEKIMPIAGELAGSSKIGEKSVEKIKKIDELLEEIELALKELQEVLSNRPNDKKFNETKKNRIKDIKGDYIVLINKKAKKAQKFFSQEIYTLMEDLKTETERLESYYS